MSNKVSVVVLCTQGRLRLAWVNQGVCGVHTGTWSASGLLLRTGKTMFRPDTYWLQMTLYVLSWHGSNLGALFWTCFDFLKVGIFSKSKSMGFFFQIKVLIFKNGFGVEQRFLFVYISNIILGYDNQLCVCVMSFSTIYQSYETSVWLLHASRSLHNIPDPMLTLVPLYWHCGNLPKIPWSS